MHWFLALLFIGTVVFTTSTDIQTKQKRSITTGNDTQRPAGKIWTEKLPATNIGGFKYQDGEVILLQNELKKTDFFFTPFPFVEPNLTTCSYNDWTDNIDLTLVVSLYTTNMLESIEDYIKKTYRDICDAQHCKVSLLPMHSIRLSEKRRRTPESQKRFTINNDWQSNAQLRQRIEFEIHPANMSICENLKSSITSRCSLSHFEIQYSLHSQQTVARTVEVTTEHITKTSMYNKIKSQFALNDQETVALTGNDYKNLLSEIMDQVTMSLVVEEDYESMQDSAGIDRLLDRQLQYQQIHLTRINDRLWDSLYWTPELTRPDRLSKVLNKIIKQDATDSNKFLYDYSKTDEASKQNLKLDEKQKLDTFEKHLTEKSQSHTDKANFNIHLVVGSGGSALDLFSGSIKLDTDVNTDMEKSSSQSSLHDDVIYYTVGMNRFNSTNNEKKNDTTIILQRKDVEKLLHYLSQHVELEGEMIKPKPIDVILVKIGSLKSYTKLFSNMVRVKTRMNMHTLPLRCPDKYDNRSLANDWLIAQQQHLSKVVDALQTNLTTDLNKMQSTLIAIESRLNQTMIENVNKSEILINAIESRINKEIVDIENRLKHEIKENTNATISLITNRLLPIQAGQGGQVKMGYCHAHTGLREKRDVRFARSINHQCIARNVVQHVWFQQSFPKTPSLVHVALSMIDSQSYDRNVRIEVNAESITAYGFDIRFHSWHDSAMHEAHASWLACT